MNKTDMINAVVGKTGLSKKDVTTAIEATLEAITEALASGEKVQLVGFGSFEVRERAARDGYNPKLLDELKKQGVPEEQAKEQAKIRIESSKVPAFKPAKGLKDTVAGK